MPRSYVALDLETTGLDPERDAIIEVGAVRFDLNGGCETFSTFVEPKKHIPYRVQRLTGITDENLAGAPPLATVASDLESFIGDCPVIGQNIAFDLSFLRQAYIRLTGPAYDTQELATILLPDLIEHNLRAIASHLGIEFPVQHRALADAEAAHLVFVALRARLASLPQSLIAEAQRIASAVDWPVARLLLEVLEDGASGPIRDDASLMHGAVRAPQKYGAPVAGATTSPRPVDGDDVADMLTSTARTAIESFEERPEQVAMARAIAGAFNEQGQLLVEAGTGTGKSLAYLLPAARYAIDNNARVVVSTNTINLQAQIIGQDIPIVRELLPDGEELRAAQLKGRRNYLCLLRWSNLRHAQTLSPDEAKLLVRLLLWLPHTETGDRGELRLSPGEEAVWGRLSAQQESCLATPCAFVRDGSCFLLRARKRAEASHLLVVNHALLLSDLAVGGGVIPEYHHLIVDEAQHLESEATNQFGFAASEDDLRVLLDRIATRNGGLVGSLRNAARGASAERTITRELLGLAAQAADAVESARAIVPDVFLRLAGFLRQQSQSTTDYDDRLRLTRAMRVQPDWPEIEIAWEGLGGALGRVLSLLEALAIGLQQPDATGLLDYESLVAETTELLQTGQSLRQGIGAILLRDDADTICWLTQRSGEIALASAPLRVAELLQDRLFSQKDTTVLTSATLTAEDRFDYIRETLGLADARQLQLGSPFDYAQSTIVLVPQDMPDPNQPGYMPALQETLIDLFRASHGRALALFTSHGSLRAAHGGIKKALEEEQILTLGHNIDGSPRQLIQALRDNPHTVVLGTASFWEGVDVVGEALSLLIIARLPFSVPSDPIFQARSELFDEPFNQYAVPQAVLRFKQGFGRLIRRKTDRGVMVVLDGRISSKKYGQTFLNSLPAATVHRVPLARMAGLVGQWLVEQE
jgi:DNA polymerase-3 subunit epsilon/ATP-dependent DNA helicase DinG